MRCNWQKQYLINKTITYLEAADALLQVYVFTRSTRENFSNMERLAQETLDFTCTSNSQLIIFTKLIHSQNGNDILKILVVLKYFLYTTSSVVVILTQYEWWKHTRCRIQGIDSRINTQLRDLFNNFKVVLDHETETSVQQTPHKAQSNLSW